MWCLRFFPTSEFKDLDLNKYTNISSKDCIPEIDLKYLKELCELHNDHPLASDKAEINREMLLNFFDKETYGLHYEKLQPYLRLGLKLKNYIAY